MMKQLVSERVQGLQAPPPVKTTRLRGLWQVVRAYLYWETLKWPIAWVLLCVFLPGVSQATCDPTIEDAQQASEERLHAAAQCALEQGRADQALAWMQVLVERVDYPVYQADLGRALLALGRFDAAKAAFEKAMASSPPPQAMRLLRHMHEQAAQGRNDGGTWQRAIGVAWVSDSNVNAGPSSGVVNLYGLDFQLDAGGMPVRAQGFSTELQLARTYYLSAQWQSAIRLAAEATGYAGASAYNPRTVSVEWTPTWQADGQTWRFPLGVYSLSRGNQSWQQGTWAGVNWAGAPGTQQWLAGGQWLRRNMTQATALSASQWTAWAGSKVALSDAAHYTTALRLGRDAAADAAFSSRQAGWSHQLEWALAPNWYARAEALWQYQTYDAAESWASQPRADHTVSGGLQLTWTPAVGPQWSLSVSRQRVRSNLSLYDTARNQVKLGTLWPW